MSRLFARAEWPLALAGTLSGLLTALLVLLLWSRGLGGGSAQTPETQGGDNADGGAFAASLRSQVAERLAARPVPQRPLSGFMSLRAKNVVWREPGTGRMFASAPAVFATINAAAANQFDIVLGNVLLDRPRLELVSDGRHWNYERPLAGLLAHDRPVEDRRARFSIASLRLADGSVQVAMPSRDFTLTGVEGRLAALDLAGPGIDAPRLELMTASADLRLAGGDRSWALLAERGRLSFPSATTRFDLAVVVIAGTRLEQVRGVWDPSAPGYGLTATGEAPSVELARLEFLPNGRSLPDGSARFAFQVAPLPGDGTAVRITDLSLVAGQSRASGSVAGELYPDRFSLEQVSLTLQEFATSLFEPFTGPLPYRGTITGTLKGPGSAAQLDVTARLRADSTGEQFTTRLVGIAGLTRRGLDVRSLEAQLNQVPLTALRPLLPGLPLAGSATGTVRLEGVPAEVPLTVDARLELGTGLATLAGTLDLSGDVPRYDVAGRLVAINLQSVLAPAVPPVSLTGRFELRGSGFQPATARAELRLDGGFAGWRSVRGDTIAVTATARGGTLEVGSLRFRLATATAQVTGTWRFVEPVSGSVRYAVEVGDVGPFGPYLPVVGDSVAAGGLHAEGTVSGPLSGLRLAGSLEGTGLRSGPWGAGRLAATYSLVLGGVLPEVDARFEGADITTATVGAYRAVTGNVRLLAPEFRLELQGEQARGGEVAISAGGTVPGQGARSVLLSRAYFDLPEGRWELQAPARFTWGGDDGVRVANLGLRNAQTGGQVTLDGRVLPLPRLEGRLAVANLPLDQVQDLLGRERALTGRLWADVDVSSPGGQPRIQGTFRLDDTTIRGVSMNRLEGRLDYAAGAARTEFTALFDSTGGRLELRGTLPVSISLADSVHFGLTDAGPLDATILAERVSVQPLGLLFPRVRNLAGQVDGTVSLRGTVDAPSLTGQLALSGGRVLVPELNQRFDSIAGLVSFSGRTARLADVRVRRGGWARVNGTVTLQELDRPVLDLVADIAGFQPIGVTEHPDAAFTGRVTLNGELQSLVLSGRVVIHDGYVAVPQLGARFDPAYLDAIDPTPVLGRELGGGGGSNWLSNVRIDNLRATFGEGAWVEALDATLQLRGDLSIDKAGDELRLTGALAGERGTYTLSAGPIVRRFEITRSQVRFLGSPEPNPVIDITARRIVLDPDGRRVEVEVRITGSARAPRLALASADAPDIPESELLSFLLFGRRTLAFGETFATTGELVFEQTIFGGVAEVAGLELERALSANLGLQLDLFQVRFGQGFGGLTTPTFVLGRQISNDFFLTVESGLNALFGDAGGVANSWAVRLEWAIDPRQTLELGSEPLNRARLLRGIGAALPPGRPSPQQLYGEYRRRWIY